MKWDTLKLGDIASDVQTGPFGSQLHQTDYVSYGIPVVMPKDLIHGQIVDDTIARVEQRHINRLSKYKIKEGNVLFSRRGDVGRCALVTADEDGWLCGTGCLRVTIDVDKAYSKFVFYQLQSKPCVGWVEKHAVGSTMLNLNTSIIKSIPLSIPKLEIQHRIADVLSAYDDLIENNQKQIKLLEEAAQRLYKEWFVDFRFPGWENTKIVDGVPEGWKLLPLSEFADIVMGQSPKSEFYNQERQGLPFHQGVGSYGNRYVIDDVYSSSLTRVAESNSVLFSVRAPVGRLNITRNKIVIGRGLAALTHKRGYQSFLFYLLNDHFFKEDIIGNGSIFSSVTKEELQKQIFLVAPDSIISKYNFVSSKLDDKINQLDLQKQLLSEARDRLLPKLMSGELEV